MKIWSKTDLQKDTQSEKKGRETREYGHTVSKVIMDHRPDEKKRGGGEGINMGGDC